jgi:predicted ferric reductase
MRPFVLVALYLIVTLLPLVLAWWGGRPPRSFWDELASGTAMLAFAVILVEFVLSGRFQTVSARIGMDVTMRLHQLFARTALVLALIHPFLYRAPFNPQYPWDATRQLTLTMDPFALMTGVLAWLLLAVFVVLSIGRDQIPCKYETWRLMHGVGALIIAGLTLHHALAAGRYSQDPLLVGVWLVLFVIAIASLAQVYVFAPLAQKRRPWIVYSVQLLGLKTWELTLMPEGHAGMQYKARQFTWLNVGHGPFSLHENPFSLSSAPVSGPQVQFVIKELGDFTRTVGAIKQGTRAYLDGPYGNLVTAGRAEPGIALIAGGVGIAPLLGILRQLRHDRDRRPTTLVYGNRVQEQILYREELEELARDHGTKTVHVLSEPLAGWGGRTGQIDAELIRAVFDDPQTRQWLFVLCGPPVMMEIVEDTLIGLGVPAGQILSERFSYD